MKGVFEKDVSVAVEEWLLRKLWDCLDEKVRVGFNMKVHRLAKKNWPHNLPRTASHKWLYHNHKVYSGNVPDWASWEWPEGSTFKMGRFECHFYCLVTGSHPAFGGAGICQRLECNRFKSGSVFDHHFFNCEGSHRNRKFFKEKVHTIFEASKVEGLPLSVLNDILFKPCNMWIGLINRNLFDLGLKIKHVHEFHRIFTTASILSWGRFYSCPLLP